MKHNHLNLKNIFAVSLLSLLVLSPMARSEEAPPVKLQDLKTFEVEQFHSWFDLRNYHLDGEFYMHLSNALEQDKTLKAASPADGVIHLTCQWAECSRIKASVTKGPKGPEVWSKSFGAHDFFATYWLGSYEKGPRRLSKKIIQELAEAYQGETSK